MGEPYLLHEEQTFPAAWELLGPELAGDDWPGPAWGEIWCERADDGSWSIWYMSYDNKAEEVLERTRGLRTPDEFFKIYHDCGVDFGCHPDGTELSEHIGFFDERDPVFGSLMRSYLELPDDDK